jgi:hypothetical protein
MIWRQGPPPRVGGYVCLNDPWLAKGKGQMSNVQMPASACILMTDRVWSPRSEMPRVSWAFLIFEASAASLAQW